MDSSLYIFGKLMTHAPSTYKIPTINDCPPDFRVRLLDNFNVEDSIHRSKARGEPLLLLPFSVFFAIRDAVAATGDGRANPPLNEPATCEEILKAMNAIHSASRPACLAQPRPEASMDQM